MPLFKHLKKIIQLQLYISNFERNKINKNKYLILRFT